MKYPKIYLTLDNCFAIKRWTRPIEWLSKVKEIGFPYAQASFDNEIDMLFSPDWYMDQWFEDLKKAEEETGVHVTSFYTGYSTYRTAGMGHYDDRMADHLTDNWMIKAVEKLGKRHSHMGMFFSSLTEDVLQDPEKYEEMYAKIVKRFARIGKSAQENNIYFGTEAMYAPHQPSFTIAGTKKFLQDIYQYGYPIYTTIDMGHMVGQRYFRKPSADQVKASILEAASGAKHPDFWIGSENARSIWRDAVADKANADSYVAAIMEDMDRYYYMFSTDPADDDPYEWLKALGAYSPIMHLQQTDGNSSGHSAFTPANNAKGIIKGDEVLKAIAKSYEAPDDPTMPPKSDEIYLAFEIFASNVEYPYDTIEKLQQTKEYWRQFVPKDGMRLDELL